MSDRQPVSTRWAKEFNYFRLALGFFSRIPMGTGVHYQPEFMHTCTRYFPLIGWLIGLLLVAVFHLALPLWGTVISVAVVMIASVLLTGALHEDGLADTCDGFWGGLNIESKIDIMKDSRIGTYGTCALILAFGLKFILLLSLAQSGMFVTAICVAYPLSRAMAITHVQDLPYVSNLGTVQKNKSDPLAKPVSTKHLLFVLFTGSLAVFLLSFTAAIVLFLSIISVRFCLKVWMQKHIGGFTGDVLGAAQQIQELTIYLVLIALHQGSL